MELINKNMDFDIGQTSSRIRLSSRRIGQTAVRLNKSKSASRRNRIFCGKSKLMGNSLTLVASALSQISASPRTSKLMSRDFFKTKKLDAPRRILFTEKKGIFFSMDAVIALMLILLVVFIAYPYHESAKKQTTIHSDVLNTLSKIKVGDSTNSYVVSLRNAGLIISPNNSLLEQVGEFYVTNQTLAKNLMSSLLADVGSGNNVGVWYGNTLIAASNTTPYENARDVDVASQIISGIREGDNITGFSARAYLANSLQTQYTYFGGYVGEGNISQNVTYYGNISSVNLELAVNTSFDIYVNNVNEGHFNSSPSDFVPGVYNISTVPFVSGSNIFEVRGNNTHIAGGFLKIVYASNVQYEKPTRKYFPGVQGVANVYDGFYVPGSLVNLSVFLHLNSTQSSVFLTIGNVTVFNNNTNDEKNFTLNNTYLSSLLSYSSMSLTTVPLRLGLQNASFLGSRPVNVFPVSDISGSMSSICTNGVQKCCNKGGNCNNNQTLCITCNGTWASKIDELKNATSFLTTTILNSTLQNKVGLIAFNDTVPSKTFHKLSNNNTDLLKTVSAWQAGGTTCICCGINNATDNFLNVSNSTFKSMIVMSDGVPNIACARQGTNNATKDAILAACQAFNKTNTTIYAVGFGEDVQEYVLQQIANCGHGQYYYANVDQLLQVYQQILNSITSQYQQQTIQVNGTLNARLYHDSYLEFAYNQSVLPKGLILTVEKLFDNTTSGNFSVPLNSTVVETHVNSYSGPRWTTLGGINGVSIYNLTKYGSDFTKLGDPYTIEIPTNLISTNSANIVNLLTGISVGNNTSPGSSSNKIIYTVAKDFSSFSPIVAGANGCKWGIQFEDNSILNVTVPSNYTGTDNCVYSSGNTGILANDNDAYQVAVVNLLRELDFNSNGKLDVAFTSQQLSITTDAIIGIPFTWSTQVQVRVWS